LESEPQDDYDSIETCYSLISFGYLEEAVRTFKNASQEVHDSERGRELGNHLSSLLKEKEVRENLLILDMVKDFQNEGDFEKAASLLQKTVPVEENSEIRNALTLTLLDDLASKNGFLEKTREYRVWCIESFSKFGQLFLPPLLLILLFFVLYKIVVFFGYILGQKRKDYLFIIPNEKDGEPPFFRAVIDQFNEVVEAPPSKDRLSEQFGEFSTYFRQDLVSIAKSVEIKPLSAWKSNTSVQFGFREIDSLTSLYANVVQQLKSGYFKGRHKLILKQYLTSGDIWIYFFRAHLSTELVFFDKISIQSSPTQIKEFCKLFSLKMYFTLQNKELSFGDAELKASLRIGSELLHEFRNDPQSKYLERANSILKEIVEKYPSDVKALLLLGITYEFMENHDEAKRVFERGESLTAY